MLLIHANYLDEEFRLVQGDIEIQDGKILRIGKDLPRRPEDLAVDCEEGYTVVPGFVDVRRYPGSYRNDGPVPVAARCDIVLPHDNDRWAGSD